MAKLELTGFDEVDKLFKVLGNPSEFAVKAVNEAAPILERCTQNAVKQAAGKGYASGGLAASFQKTSAKENDLGVYSVIRPVGEREDSNGEMHDYAERAAWLEYGRKGGYKRSDQKRSVTEQAPSPFREKAINDAKTECESVMEQVVFDEIDKGGRIK